LKVVIGRPRPFEVLPDTHPLLTATVGQSMPSGHAATSLAGAVILSALVRRRAVTVVLLLVAAAMAFSRVYIGVHYPGDALAGAALGAAVAGVGLTARAVRARPRPSGTPPREARAPRGG
jgi:membrane-associated phospholipid phosphatase